MAPFALSIPGYRLGVHSHKQRHHDTAHQDGEIRSPSPYADSDADSDAETQFSSTASRLPSEAINPLSHSPDTLRQLAVAGLSPEDELPSRTHPGFPHKPLPQRSKRRSRRAAPSSRRGDVGSDSGAETDSTAVTSSTRRRRGKVDDVNDKHYSARMRHLNTMTAIMHRCLRDGDIPRAKRALGLLVRTRDVDVRANHLWAIGAEILMRDGEQDTEPVPVPKRPSSLSSSSSSSSGDALSSDTDSDPDIVGEEDVREEGGNEGSARRPQRWGSAANLAQVKQYLETLIQHHPHDAHRPHLTSAVDFWPALFGIEVYSLDAELQSSLHQIHLEYGFPSSSFSRPPSPDDADKMEIDDDDEEDETNRRRRRSEEEEEEDSQDRARHAATDALRAETQRGARGLAARVDAVLENPPYNALAELLRLRGHVALFVADLYLPSRLTERCRGDDDEQRVSLRGAERRLRRRARHPDDHVALARRREEQGAALAFFRRVVAARGTLEEWVLRFLEEDDEEEGGEGRRFEGRAGGW
ncbi:hypothetical protein F4803DRAFT_573319 [Xylaria telfairii]|nr:hypothetical protein F4803DRAFT_573319 [Xylaria telfairii]